MREVVAHCSFCGKSNAEVNNLIAGPNVWICDECISLCGNIIDEQNDMGIMDKRDPLAARLLCFLDDCTGNFIHKPVLISDDLLAEKLDADAGEVNKSLKYLKRNKKVSVIPVSDGVNIYVVNGKSVSAEHVSSKDLHSIPVNVLVKSSTKIKLLS